MYLQKIPQALERDIESYFVTRVTRAGGITRKLKWIGRNGAPDRFVSFKRTGPILVELKRPGQKPRPGQAREHAMLADAGVMVLTISTCEQVDNFINDIIGGDAR